MAMRLLSDRRDDVMGERTRCANRLHVLLRDLRPGGAPVDLSATAAAALLKTVRPGHRRRPAAQAIARSLVADLRRLDQTAKALVSAYDLTSPRGYDLTSSAAAC